jgi:hypothetical protein
MFELMSKRVYIVPLNVCTIKHISHLSIKTLVTLLIFSYISSSLKLNLYDLW